MIELNNITMHDFLNRKLVKELLDAGVDMTDATYFIVHEIYQNKDFVMLGTPGESDEYKFDDIVPTYTISQLHFKLHEWIFPTINGREYSGGLQYCKDAPFYCFYYDLTCDKNDDQAKASYYISAEGETPIESLAYLLIQCHKKDIGCRYPDCGHITNKYKEYIWK